MKRAIVIVLIMAVFFGMMAVSANASYSFNDVPDGYWAENYIAYAQNCELIHGMGDGNFYPEGTLTEAQCAQILMNISAAADTGWHLLEELGKEAVSRSELRSGVINEEATDNIPDDAWYAPAARFVWEKTRLVIEPERTATREFICRLIYAYETDNLRADFYHLGAIPFSDCDSLNEAALTAIRFCVANGFVCGFPDGTFRPEEGLTRAQGAKIFALLYDYLEDEITVSEQFAYDAANDIVQMAEEMAVTTDLYTVRDDTTFYRAVTIFTMDDEFPQWGTTDETYAAGTFYVSELGGYFISPNGEEMSLAEGEKIMREIGEHFTLQEKAIIASMHFLGYTVQYGWMSYHSPSTGVLANGCYFHDVSAQQIQNPDLWFIIGINAKPYLEKPIELISNRHSGRDIVELQIRLQPMDRYINW